MSREDVELARALFEQWFGVGRTLFEASDELPPAEAAAIADVAERLFTDDVEYREDPLWPGSATYKGREAVLRQFTQYTDVFGVGSTIELEDVVDAGDRVVVIYLVRMKGAASGAVAENRWSYVVRLRDGRIAELLTYFDPDEALRAVGQ